MLKSCAYFLPDRRQRHHPGDRAPKGPGPGPAQAHADLLHGRAVVPSRARVPALPVRRGPRAHGTREAAESVGNTGKRKCCFQEEKLMFGVKQR